MRVDDLGRNTRQRQGPRGAPAAALSPQILRITVPGAVPSPLPQILRKDSQILRTFLSNLGISFRLRSPTCQLQSACKGPEEQTRFLTSHVRAAITDAATAPVRVQAHPCRVRVSAVHVCVCASLTVREGAKLAVQGAISRPTRTSPPQPHGAGWTRDTGHGCGHQWHPVQPRGPWAAEPARPTSPQRRPPATAHRARPAASPWSPGSPAPWAPTKLAPRQRPTRPHFGHST